MMINKNKTNHNTNECKKRCQNKSCDVECSRYCNYCLYSACIFHNYTSTHSTFECSSFHTTRTICTKTNKPHFDKSNIGHYELDILKKYGYHREIDCVNCPCGENHIIAEHKCEYCGGKGCPYLFKCINICKCSEYDKCLQKIQNSRQYKSKMLKEHNILIDIKYGAYGEYFDDSNNIKIGFHNKSNHRCVICGKRNFDHYTDQCAILCECYYKCYDRSMILHPKEQHFCRICEKIGGYHNIYDCTELCICEDNKNNHIFIQYNPLHGKKQHKCKICDKIGYEHPTKECPELCVCCRHVDNYHNINKHTCFVCKKIGIYHAPQKCPEICLCTGLHNLSDHCCNICNKGGHIEDL